MRKTIIAILVLFALSSLSYAQSARNPIDNDPGKTVLGNVGAQGLDVTGNPGYLELIGYDGDSDATNGTAIQYYLWVDRTGDLRIASRVTMETKSSFPSGDWRLPNFNIGTIVGTQS